MTLILNGVAVAESSTPNVGGATQRIMTVAEYRIIPAVGAAAAIHAAITLPSSGTTTVTTGITQPDFPRVLAITGGALLMAGNVVVNGTDVAGAVISETFALNGTAQVLGTKAFATVTSIVVPTRVTIGDTVTIDTRNVFGIPNILYNAADIFIKLFNGAVDAGTAAASATLCLNLYTLAGTPNGSKVLALRYLV